MSEVERVDRACEGAARALAPAEVADLAERHIARLRAYVRLRAGSLLRSRESLSDVVQSTLRELLDGATGLEFANEAQFRCWLYTAATHKIVSKNRYWSAAMRNPDREQALSAELWDLPERDSGSPSRSPTRFVVHGEDLERLRAAFADLDEQDRRILAMRKLFDVPASTIAAELGIAESTVRWRLGVLMTELASRLA